MRLLVAAAPNRERLGHPASLGSSTNAFLPVGDLFFDGGFAAGAVAL